ncbi:hypothetical protein L3Q82_005408 [Scortum barcoo]|uniref:Uncharacterized protein n=1 Tax=Scortum barcoo TaxID=214431 RepID=A0ACB8VAB3_9TELE|nr:hypothetical protein L3Q82_005408 [Scortum barcoo]
MSLTKGVIKEAKNTRANPPGPKYVRVMTSSSTGVSPHRAGTPHCHSAGDRSGDTRRVPNMSTGPRTQAAFIQGNQNTVEHEASHSALFYLLQEVSKLASPIHSSFLDENPPSTWLSETSVEREEEGAHLFQISNKSCQHSLSHLSHYNQMKEGQEKSHDSKVTALVEPLSEHNSPWKVLSLINLQCERLLHHSDVEESDPSSVSSPDKLSHSTDKLLTVTDQRVEVDCVSVECTLKPSRLKCERQEVPACVGPMEDARVDCSGGASSYKPQCFVQSQTAEKTDTFGPKLVEKNATASSQHKDKRELSVNRQFEWNKECKMDCLSSEWDVLNVLLSENASSRMHLPDAFIDTQVTFNSKEDVGVTLSKPALTLDHNANLALASDTHLPPPSSILSSSQSASLLFITTEKCHLLSEQDDIVTASKPDCTHAPIEEKSDAVAQLKSCISHNGETNPSLPETSEPETKCMQKEEISSPSAQQWRSKTPRKQPHPSRSPDIQDPDFQGVTFRMDTELDDSREQCRLLITSKYSKRLCKSVRKPKMRTRMSQKSIKTSSSDEESDLATSISKLFAAALCLLFYEDRLFAGGGGGGGESLEWEAEKSKMQSDAQVFFCE